MAQSFDYKTFLKQLSSEPGIYQMYDAKGKILYVGKAKNLKKRVSSYFLKQQSSRIASLVSQIADIQIITTQTENEALLLENTLIKSLKPKYNILFRDDKSYPYIYLSSHLAYPSLRFHRGAKTGKGKYFGPYPSGGAVRHTLNLLQKLFKVRQCRESYFKNRSRPCMQYQIKRCSGPCVKKISEARYAEDVKATELFLQGKSQQLITSMIEKMQQAAKIEAYESAAKFRDQINSLRKIQEKQNVIMGSDDLDIVSLAHSENQGCVEVLFVRKGRLIGDHSYFCTINNEQTEAEILESFIPQFYLNKKHCDDIPKAILMDIKIANQNWLMDALTQMKGQKVNLKTPSRGDKLKWLQLAHKNATVALQSRLTQKKSYEQKFEGLKAVLKLPNEIQKIECFDISHTMGEATVASCVVFSPNGAEKNQYRRFNIDNITAGDDYAAMHQALTRRYQKLKQTETSLPDILLIDGGKGQLTQAENILDELQLPEIQLLGIVKGEGRKAEFDRILAGFSHKEILLEPHSGSFHLLQEIRNEAHRFAIGGHKAKREKKRSISTLEEVEGIGGKRRQSLLNYFGGIQGLKQASVEQIARVPGISLELAEKVAKHFQ